MNSFLLSLGVAIVLALVAALVGPYFIDWSGYRAEVEARITEITGSDAKIGGELDIRFLPTGRIDISGLEIRRDDLPFPIVIVPELSAEFSLAAFLRGRVEILDITFTQPIVSLTVRDDGSPAFGVGLGADNGHASVAVGEFTIADGTLVFVEGDGTPLRTLSGIDISGNAETLAGPIKLEGGFSSGPVRYAFRLGTGRVQATGGVRTKFNLTSSVDAGSISLDAVLALDEGRPVVDGAVTIDRPVGETGAVPPGSAVPGSEGDEFDDGTRLPDAPEGPGFNIPWKLSASIKGGIENILLRELKIEVGAADRAVSLEGTARAGLYPDPKFSAILSARQLDLDRLTGNGAAANETVSPVELAGILNELATKIVRLDIPTDLSISADGVLLGGNIIENLGADLEVLNDRIVVDRISARLPGGTDLVLSGTFKPGQLPVVDSVIRLSSENAAALGAWMGVDRSAFGPFLAPGRRVKIEFEGGVSTDPDRITIRDAVARIDGNEISGGLSYPLGNSPGGMDISLDFGELDLDRFVQPESVARGFGGPWLEGIAGAFLAGRDTAVRLTAETISSGDFNAEGLDVNIGISGDVLTIHRLNINSLSGLQFTGQGQIDDIFDKANGAISMQMTISDLVEFLPFMETAFGVASITDSMAGALSPVSVELDIAAESAPAGTVLALGMTGDMAGTRVQFEGEFEGSLADITDGKITANLNLADVDGQKILRQLGLGEGAGGLPRIDAGRVSANIGLEGRATEALATSGGLNFLGSNFAFSGSYFPGEEQTFSGTLDFSAGDILPLSELLGIPKPGDEIFPASLRAFIVASPTGIKISAMTGRLGGSNLSGDLELGRDGARTLLDGRIETDVISLPWLLTLILGEGTGSTGSDNARWPAAPFDIAALDRFDGEVEIKSDKALLGAGIELEDLEFTLVAAGNQVALNVLSATQGEIKLEANLDLVGREGGQVSTTMRLKLDGGDLQNYLTRAGGSYASGPFALSGQVAGTGRSWRGVVASLNGDGVFQAGPGTVDRLDPFAFARLLSDADRAEGAIALTEAGISETLGNYLNETSLSHDGMDTVFSVSDGVLNARNAIIVSGVMPVRGVLSVDLQQLELASRWEFAPLSVQPDGGDTISNVPAVARRISGPFGSENDELDVTTLTGWLSVRRMEKNLAELEQARENIRVQQEQERETLENLAGEESDSGEQEVSSVPDPESNGDTLPVNLNLATESPNTEVAGPSDTSPRVTEVEVEPEKLEVSGLPEVESPPVSIPPASDTPFDEIVQDALRDAGQAETRGPDIPPVASDSPATEIPSRLTNALPDLPPPTVLGPTGQLPQRSALVPPRGLATEPAAPIDNSRRRRPPAIPSPEGAGMMN